MKVKELIKNPENWTTGTCYRDKNGKSCGENVAHSYCLLGAIGKCYGQMEFNPILEILEKKLGENNVSTWNDASTHAEVLALVEELDI